MELTKVNRERLLRAVVEQDSDNVRYAKDRLEAEQQDFKATVRYELEIAARAYENAMNCFLALPDEIVLDLGTREFEMGDPGTCMCGWVARVGLARIAGLLPDDINPEEGLDNDEEATVSPEAREVSQFARDRSVFDTCEHMFPAKGDGSWHDVYQGVCEEEAPYIELAFIDRFNRAVARQA